MDKEEIYVFIGELAISLYAKKIQISLSSLNSILQDRNCGYGNNRGVAKAVSASWKRWNAKDPVIHHAIAYTFVDKDGNLPWNK